MELTQEDKQTLLLIARSAIERVVAGKPERILPEFSANLESLCGAFVTLKMKSELRGCIGFVEAKKPLYKAVREAAIKSSREDPRFFAVSPIELSQLQIEISILSPLTPMTSPEEIEIGVHGLFIQKNSQRGLLLPSVATDMKWNREEFLDNVAMKANLDKDAWREPGIKLFLFTTEIIGEFGKFEAQV